MTYIHAPVNVILPRSNGITVELGNPERVVPIPSGAQGLPGEPGFSPVVSVEPITDGNRVTITDADGDTSFDVMNGAQGEQGEPGEGVPAGGAQGQVLKKASNADYDTVWSNESGTVLSVNGQTGVVVLDASDVGALPDDTFIPTKTSDLTNDSGFTDVHVGASAPTDPDTQIWLDTDEPGQSAVTSVNGASGAVTLDASDVGGISIVGPLWTNPNPNSSFAAQTISLDLSGYDEIAVNARCVGRSTVVWNDDMTQMGFVKVGSQYFGMVNFPGAQGAHLLNAYRAFSATASAVTFKDTYVQRSDVSADPFVNNLYGVPLEIYGIKGVLPL